MDGLGVAVLGGREPSLAAIVLKVLLVLVLGYFLYVLVGLVAGSPGWVWQGATVEEPGGIVEVTATYTGPAGVYEPVVVEPRDPELVEAILDYLNTLRAEHGVPPLTLHPTGVAQYRADDMVSNRYFGHCSPDGTPYYAFYTMLGGAYYPEENIGLTVAVRGTLGVDPLEEAIGHLNSMVYDDEESDWGHRDSLLDPTNNMADIAVSYDGKMYILEIILEKAWINWTQKPSYTDGRVLLEGTVALEGSEFETVAVYRAEKPSVIQWPVENGVTFTCPSLDPGEPIAIVAPQPVPGLSLDVVVAEEWDVRGDWFHVAFSYGLPEGEGYVYYVIVWIKNTVGVEHPYDPERYAESLPALLLVLGEGGAG